MEATLDARRVLPGEESPRLDGLLSEEVWQRAVPVSGFRQRDPWEGEPATEDTEVRVLFDDEALWVGITAFDSQPDDVVGRILQRDRVLNAFGFGGFRPAGDDVVVLLLDTFRDRRNGMVLATNPNGAEFDALITDDGDEISVDWRGIWEVRSARVPQGWTAEFRIPWRSLRFSADRVQEWGINVYRFVQRTQEESMWRSWEREGGGFDRVSRAGSLRGMADLPRASLNLEAKPFTLAARRQELDDANAVVSTNDFDYGLDLKSEVRPGLVLDLTYNTDFAQVEVDDQQVNLTRFSLFFPERRDFFLENAGIFEFGQRGFGGPPPYLAFFSRRIGIGSEGVVPILGGARLTGRAGNQTIGLLSVGTDAAPGTNQELFNVFRVKRDVGEMNYVGFMATDRRGEGEANTVVGTDFAFRLSPTVETGGFFSRSFTDGLGGEGNAFQASANYTGDAWGGFFRVLQVDPGAQASSGFITRNDIRESFASIRRTFRPIDQGIRRLEFRTSGAYQTTTDSRFQDFSVSQSISLTLNSGDNLNVSAERAESRVDDAFTVAGQVDVPAGRFSADQISVRAGTASQRPWRISGNARIRDYFGGTLSSVTGSVTVIPSPAFSLTSSWTHNDVSLPNGDFVADIVSVRAVWSLSTQVFTNALVQYNSLTENILANVRFNFIHRPGSDLFLVLTEERGVDDDVWAFADRGMVAKLTYVVRL